MRASSRASWPATTARARCSYPGPARTGPTLSPRSTGPSSAARSRQSYALANPLNRADGDIAPYRAVRTHATGMLIMTILAVDR